MKKNKPNGIPLETLFESPYFQRNFEILMRENPGDTKLQRAITEALIGGARRDGERVKKHQEASSKGGAETAKVKTDALTPRNKKIIDQAIILLKNGRDRRDLASILAAQYDLSARRIRDILRKNGI